MYIIFLILYNISFAQNSNEKVISNDNFLQWAELKKVEYTQEYIYTFELSALKIHDSILIRKYDYDFNQVGKTINLSYDEYGVDIDEVYIDKDTLVVIGHIIEKWDSPLRNGFHLFVRKYYNDELIYDNIAITNLSISTYHNTSTPRIYYNSENIYSIFRTPYIGVIKYDINGNVLKIDTLINDPVSNGEDVGAIGAYGIIEHNNNLYAFLFKKNTDKTTLFYNVYNTNFDFIKSDTIFNNRYILFTEFDFFNFNDSKYIAYGEYLSQDRIANTPIRQLIEVNDDGVNLTNIKLGVNYPDRINSVVKFNDNFIAGGSYHSTERNGGSFALLQILDNELNPINYLTFDFTEENVLQEIIDIKVLNEKEIIVVGKITVKGIFLKKINLSELSVESENNIKSYLINDKFILKEYIFEPKVYNSLGNKVDIEITINGSNTELDFTNFPKGIYFVKTKNEVYKIMKY